MLDALGDAQGGHPFADHLSHFGLLVARAVEALQIGPTAKQKLVGQLADYFARMHPLYTDQQDLSRFYTGLANRHPQLEMPPWDEVGGQFTVHQEGVE